MSDSDVGHFKIEGQYDKRSRPHTISGEMRVSMSGHLAGFLYDQSSECPIQPIFGYLLINPDAKSVMQFVARPIGHEELSPIEYQLIGEDAFGNNPYPSGIYTGAWRTTDRKNRGLEYDNETKLWIPGDTRNTAKIVVSASESLLKKLLKEIVTSKPGSPR